MNLPPVARFLRVVYKLGPLMFSLLLFRKTHRGKEPTPKEKQKLQKQGKKLFESLVDLGPAFIKLGQILSVRPDVVPPEYIKELERLQDDVPPAPFEEVRKLIESELGALEHVFESFDGEPVASASLGQVYKAVYKGEQVAVKVNRPGIAEVVKRDAQVLKLLLSVLGVLVDRNIAGIMRSLVDEYSSRITREVDYKIEANNMSIIKKELAHQKDVVVPTVFQEVSTGKVLVMSYHGGVKISDVAGLDANGIDRQRLARRLSRIYLEMVLGQPLFHADPHPGNIAVGAQGEIILYDYGMVGSLDDYTRKHVVRLYAAMAAYDPASIVDELYELGALDPAADRTVIEKGFELSLRELRGQTVSQWEIRRLRELADRMISEFPFRLPEELVLYMRMATILESVCTTLDPSFRFVRVMS
ncbi:MAG: AarF/UbiB family protein, partial [Thermoprotei archaeon]